MRVQDVLSNAGSLLGSELRIEGFLVGLGDTCYVTNADEAWLDRDHAILLDQPGLMQRLDRIVGAWIGGRAAYRDDVVVTGRLERSGTDPFPLALRAISSLVVTREAYAETYQVLP